MCKEASHNFAPDFLANAGGRLNLCRDDGKMKL